MSLGAWQRIKLAYRSLTSTLASPQSWLLEALGGLPSSSGMYVSESSALKITAVSAAVRILAESVGFLPLIVFERLSGGGKRRATEHPLYRPLHDEPNPYMSSVTWRETGQGHLALWGNSYSEIEWGAHGQVKALWPLLPNRVWPEVKNNQFAYHVHSDKAGEVILMPGDVLHIPGLGFDGIKGYSPVTLAREALGLALATEKFGATFFLNGSRASGVLEVPASLEGPASANLRKSFADANSGLDNVGKTILLEDGVKWRQLSIPNNDAQFLETRKFQVTEIARMFRIPPHMLADLDRATFSNIEHQSLEFVIFTLGPWLRRWEQELNRKLFSAQEKRRYFIEFNVDGLLRGDIASRYAAYNTGRNGGWLSADDIRELENMNPLPGGAGKIYWMPVNMVDASKPRPEPVAPPAPAPAPEKPESQPTE